MAFGAYPGAYLFSYFCDLLHPGEHLGTYPHEALIALGDAFKAFSTDEVAGWRNCWFAVPTFLFSCIRKYHVRLCCSKGAGAYLGAYPNWGRIVLERHKGVCWVRAGVAHTFGAYHVHLCASRMPEFRIPGAQLTIDACVGAYLGAYPNRAKMEIARFITLCRSNKYLARTCRGYFDLGLEGFRDSACRKERCMQKG